MKFIYITDLHTNLKMETKQLSEDVTVVIASTQEVKNLIDQLNYTLVEIELDYSDYNLFVTMIDGKLYYAQYRGYVNYFNSPDVDLNQLFITGEVSSSFATPHYVVFSEEIDTLLNNVETLALRYSKKDGSMDSTYQRLDEYMSTLELVKTHIVYQSAEVQYLLALIHSQKDTFFTT